MSNTLEKDTTRFKELVAIGFENLNGPEKEEYSVLLQLNPSFVDLLNDESGDETVTTQVETKMKEEKPKKDKSAQVVSKPKKEKEKVEREYRSYFMVSNVLHDGVAYTKDQEVAETDPNFQILEEKGFLIKK